MKGSTLRLALLLSLLALFASACDYNVVVTPTNAVLDRVEVVRQRPIARTAPTIVLDVVLIDKNGKPIIITSPACDSSSCLFYVPKSGADGAVAPPGATVAVQKITWLGADNPASPILAALMVEDSAVCSNTIDGPSNRIAGAIPFTTSLLTSEDPSLPSLNELGIFYYQGPNMTANMRVQDYTTDPNLVSSALLKISTNPPLDPTPLYQAVYRGLTDIAGLQSRTTGTQIDTTGFNPAVLVIACTADSAAVKSLIDIKVKSAAVAVPIYLLGVGDQAVAADSNFDTLTNTSYNGLGEQLTVPSSTLGGQTGSSTVSDRLGVLSVAMSGHYLVTLSLSGLSGPVSFKLGAKVGAATQLTPLLTLNVQ